jgi:hypothetical protein
MTEMGSQGVSGYESFSLSLPPLPSPRPLSLSAALCVCLSVSPSVPLRSWSRVEARGSQGLKSSQDGDRKPCGLCGLTAPPLLTRLCGRAGRGHDPPERSQRREGDGTGTGTGTGQGRDRDGDGTGTGTGRGRAGARQGQGLRKVLHTELGGGGAAWPTSVWFRPSWSLDPEGRKGVWRLGQQ